MANPVFTVRDDVGAVIPPGTPQEVSGQVPGTPTAFRQYSLLNEGPGPVDTAFNVVGLISGRLVSIGGDLLGEGVGYVDEGAIEFQTLDAIGGATTSAIRSVGANRPLFLGNLGDGESVFFQTRVNGATETAQIELVYTFLHDAASAPVGDDVGTGSGISWPVGDGETSDWWKIDGSVAAAGSPDETFLLPAASRLHLGEPAQELVATVFTPVEDGAEVAISPADATKAYGIRVSAGRLVILSDVWSVTAATAAVSADTAAGDATSTLTAGVDWVRIGAEIHLVKTVTDDDNIVLETNHVAGASGVPLSVPYTIQRGLQAATPLGLGDYPAVPVGELEVARIQRKGDDLVEAVDVVEVFTEGFFARSSALLVTTVGRGRAKVHGFEARPQTSNSVNLTANSTNLVQLNGPNNAALEVSTDGSRGLGTMPLYEDVTDGTVVTSSTDLRQFLNEQPASVYGLNVTLPADFAVWTNPLTCPVYIKPGSFHFELGLPPGAGDPPGLGWTAGAWILEIFKVENVVRTSLFVNSASIDARPTIDFDASSSITTAGRHERLRLAGGGSLVFRLEATPTGTGDDPDFLSVGWSWSPAR